MLKASKLFLKIAVVFTIGGYAYGLIEIMFRGYSHISMFVAGGICFVLIGALSRRKGAVIPFVVQMLLSAVIITLVELVVGLIVNVKMNLYVWDYSSMPMNYKGQICLPFTVMWFFLSAVGIVLEDFVRHSLFGEPLKLKYRFPRFRQAD